MDKKPVRGKKQGAILIVVFLAVALLVIISIGMFLRMFSESRASERHRESTQAFYLAEAAIDRAISKLPSNMAFETGIPLGAGKYSLEIYPLVAGKKWRVVGTGEVPLTPPVRAQKRIEAFLEKKDLDDNFWNNFIYSAGNVEFKGGAYNSTGDVRFAGSLLNGQNVPLANQKHDPSINPLAMLDFDYLKTEFAMKQIKSDGHSNYYPAGDTSFPTSFWFDVAAGIPNVVFIEGDLKISGNKTIGGFIIVPGNYVDPSVDPNNVSITGNVSVDGCVYTRGYFSNKGGGNSLNINGGVWAGKYVDIRGGVVGQNNQAYMNAIRNNINPSTEVQIISWREEPVP